MQLRKDFQASSSILNVWGITLPILLGTALGNAPYKQGKVQIGEKRREADGNPRSYIRQVVDVCEVDLLEIRKSLNLATNS